jgi:hypothetical protein
MTLAHPQITPSELAALTPSAAPAVIEMGAGRGQPPYKLVWLRGPDGHSRLYRLVPEPRQTPTTSEGQPGGQS